MLEKICRYCRLERIEEGDVGTHYEGKEWCKCQTKKQETNETINVLSIIAQAQETCASVKLEIGTTTTDGHQVVHGGVYITDCPASVIIALEKAGYVLCLEDGKLSVCYKKEVA